MTLARNNLMGCCGLAGRGFSPSSALSARGSEAFGDQDRGNGTLWRVYVVPMRALAQSANIYFSLAANQCRHCQAGPPTHRLKRVLPINAPAA
jgi:hypothetical protein